ncbi:uncharacterized protein LOC135684758 [Rhopilema esculentum]|uniref:uncharacterized protein LOC135684758 n=1 Tax=Rhopilema esculentum TaxID=499914 RepID=UPI0031CDE2CC|eukprot:gene16535-7958_t
MKESVFLPESTLRNVDDYIASEMYTMTVPRTKGGKYVPKFTVDGHGRWREVKNLKDEDQSRDLQTRNLIYHELLLQGPNQSESSKRPLSMVRRSLDSTSSSVMNMSETPYTTQPSGHFRPTTNESFRSYKHLSTSLRSNVFPGLGKEKWESSSKKEFVPKQIPGQWQNEIEDFGVKKDAYMKWAEHDVYRQRLMKAWDKYITEAPKVERQALPKVVKEEKSKPSRDGETKKKAKGKKEAKKSKKEDETPTKQVINELQPTRIEVQPAKSDDDFWDFYDKPFEQS